MGFLRIEIYATTGTGPVRKGNEDNYLFLNLANSKFWTKTNGSDEFVIQSQKFEVDKQGVVLAVSDGCGGLSGGEMSSEMVVETVKNMLTGEISDFDNSFYDGLLIERLYDAAVYANSLINHKGRTVPEYNNMGCTLTAAGITSDAVDFLQVGDSRGYLIRKYRIYQITRDQSLVNKLIDEGQISPEESETHPLKNVILQALGANTEVSPDGVRLIPNRDDILLLCSDGLSNKLKDEDLVRIISDNLNDLQNACQNLIKETNDRGGEDNTTVILAKLSGDELIEPTDSPIVINPLKFKHNSTENEV